MSGRTGPPPGFVERPSRGPFTRMTGPFFERSGTDAVIRAFRVEERHTNALGIAHGGMLMAFLDSVLAGAVSGQVQGSFVTLRMTTDFLAPARLGDWVEGRAGVTRSTRSLCYVRGEARIGERKVAVADAVFRLLPRRHRTRGEDGAGSQDPGGQEPGKQDPGKQDRDEARDAGNSA